MNRSFYPRFDKRALNHQDHDFLVGSQPRKADKTFGLTLHTVLFNPKPSLWMLAVQDRYRQPALTSVLLSNTRQRIVESKALGDEEAKLLDRRFARIVGSFIPPAETSRSLPILAPYLDVALLGADWLGRLFTAWTTLHFQRPDLSQTALLRVALQRDPVLQEAIDAFLFISLAKIYILMLMLLKPQIPATRPDTDRTIRFNDIDEFCSLIRKGLAPFLKAQPRTTVDAVIHQFASLCEPHSIKAVAAAMYERVVQSPDTLKELFPPAPVPSAMLETALRRKKQPKTKPVRKVKNPAPLRKGKRAPRPA